MDFLIQKMFIIILWVPIEILVIFVVETKELGFFTELSILNIRTFPLQNHISRVFD